MDEIEVEIQVRETVKVNVSVRDIIWGMQELPLSERWAATANILDGIKLEDGLTESQKEIVIKFLKKQLSRFN